MKTKLIVLSILIFHSIILLAQPGGGPGGDPAPLGFTEVLLAAGAIYGSRQAWRNKRKLNNEKDILA